MKKSEELEDLIFSFKSLPGISQKLAEKIAVFLINQDNAYIENFIDVLKQAKNQVHFCSKCNNICNNEICYICENTERDSSKLCIVSTSEDLDKIEETNSYNGKYYVLNGEINVKSKSSIDKKILTKLMDILRLNNIKEVILATNWTPNGEATAYFLKKIINEISEKTSIYRLAVGLPINSALNYADNETLSQAIKNKTKY